MRDTPRLALGFGPVDDQGGDGEGAMGSGVPEALERTGINP